jgi:hypothetical protein
MWKVEQNANRVVLIDPKGPSTTYHVEGVELPELTDHSFAVWHALPATMLRGEEDIVIDGPIDPVAAANAETLSRIWAMWMPMHFRPLRLVSGARTIAPSRGARERLLFFSGGVDSTYRLISQPRLPKAYALTIHGMDYRPDDEARFRALLEKTQPLLEEWNGHRVTIRTDVTKYGNATVFHGFTLAGCAMLLSDLFETAELSADHTWEQDLMAGPSGTNHVTNRYLRGSDWRLESVSGDVTRTEKVAAIAKNETACRSISFCTDKTVRPHNCGRCAKCLRTKAMFMVTSGIVPPIFLDAAFAPSMLDRIDLRSRNEQAFYADIYLSALANGTEHVVQRLGQRFRAAHDNPLARLERFARRVAGMSARARSPASR